MDVAFEIVRSGACGVQEGTCGAPMRCGKANCGEQATVWLTAHTAKLDPHAEYLSDP
jgi:hypothetical protein